MNSLTKKFQYLPIETLQRCRFQPRSIFPELTLQELAESIQSHGIIEPILVRPIQNDFFEIIAGERRWRAAQLAGLAEVPCLIAIYSDEEVAALSLIENIQREDLNVLDEAAGYQRLLNEFHFHQEEIALLIGKSRSHIANLLRLLTLSRKTQEYLRHNILSLGHARMLVGLPTHEQEKLAEQIQKNQWSVRKIEHIVKNIKSSTPKKQNIYTQPLNHLETQLSEHLGTEVHITQNNDHTGWLNIKFYSLETLDGLLERIDFRYNDDF